MHPLGWPLGALSVLSWALPRARLGHWGGRGGLREGAPVTLSSLPGRPLSGTDLACSWPGPVFLPGRGQPRLALSVGISIRRVLIPA
eukprot:639165-Pyramimonas_sp.AAC.1